MLQSVHVPLGDLGVPLAGFTRVLDSEALANHVWQAQGAGAAYLRPQKDLGKIRPAAEWLLGPGDYGLDGLSRLASGHLCGVRLLRAEIVDADEPQVYGVAAGQLGER